MRLTVLGCRAGMPADGEASSGYLVEAGGRRLLLDCGPGVATVLSGLGPAARPDAVIVTHLHLDHCHDLLPLGKSLLAPLVAVPGDPVIDPVIDRAIDPVPLLVPSGARDVLDRWAALFPVTTVPVLDRAFDLAFDVREYRPGAQRLEGWNLELVALSHAAPNCGVRIRDGDTVLAYTGDSGPTPALVDLARGADVLLAECTLEVTDQGPHGHLSAGDAARVAAEAGVAELVLTHFAATDPAWLRTCVDRARARFAGPVRVARPHSVFTPGGLEEVAS